MACAHVWSFAWRPMGWSARCPCGLAVVVDEGVGPGHGRLWTYGDQPATLELVASALASLYDQRLRWLQEQATGGRPSGLGDAR